MNSLNKNQDIHQLKTDELTACGRKAEKFRYGRCGPSDRLLASITAHGIVSPLVVCEDKTIICGFRRHEAACMLKRETVPAVITASPRESFLDGVWDNIAFRDFSSLELGELLQRISDTADVSEETIIKTYLPALGLAPSRKLLEKYRLIAAFPETIKTIIAENELKKSHIFQLLRFAAPDAEALAGLFAQLHPSAGEARILSEGMLDLAQKRKCTPAEVIKDRAVESIAGRNDAPRHRIHALRSHLRRETLPQFSRHEDEIQRLIREADLPAHVQVHVPPDYTRQQLEISIRVKNPSDYTQAVSSLNGERAQEAVVEILHRLRGDRSRP